MAPKKEQDSSAGASINLAHRSASASGNDGDVSMGSTNAPQNDASSDSDESSSGDESDDSASDDGEDIATVKPGSKPDFSARVASGAPSLQDRLKSFLPQLAEANDKLEKGGVNEYSMEDVKDDEPHIEMNLGLGVLKELSGKGDEEDDSASEDENEEEDSSASPERKRKEKDVMGKLMGGRENQTAGIEEVG